MRIAVASDNGKVAEHFGHCPAFEIFTAEEQQIVGHETIPNPGHRPGFLPNFLHNRGVQVIIAGGMGGGAVAIFEEKGIGIVAGASGPVRDAAEAWLQGRLRSTGAVCQAHEHHHECGEHQ